MNTVGRFAALLLPATLLGSWVAIARGQEAPAISVCRHPAADGQEARPLDLGRVDREYTRASRAFRERLRGVEERTLALRDLGHDAGIKACARPEARTETLREPLPPQVWGRRLYFLDISRDGRLSSSVPSSFEPSDVVFLLKYPSLEVAGKLAARLKVGVTPATGALAERLGIRCASTLVTVSRDGKSLSLLELLP